MSWLNQIWHKPTINSQSIDNHCRRRWWRLIYDDDLGQSPFVFRRTRSSVGSNQSLLSAFSPRNIRFRRRSEACQFLSISQGRRGRKSSEPWLRDLGGVEEKIIGRWKNRGRSLSEPLHLWTGLGGGARGKRRTTNEHLGRLFLGKAKHKICKPPLVSRELSSLRTTAETKWELYP